jgi:hypothetical protein
MLRRRRRRRQREEYERQIEELKEAGDLSPEDVRATLIAQTSAADKNLVGDLVSSSFLDSTEFRAVEAYISAHPSRLPRASKRMFNHAQLLTEIARSRDMFGLLVPEHLAKWLVLRERWPAIGRAVLDEPTVMRELETAAHSGDLNGHREGLVLNAHEDADELVALLVEEPPLAGVIERLIYFTPNGR